jgi:hypothetical protein
MNCLYCQKTTEYHGYKDNGKNRIFYACSPCDTYFIVDNVGKHIETNIWLPNKSFVFSIDIINRTCCLHNRNKAGSNNQFYYQEFQLSHIPDWAPQNIENKIKSFLVFS